MFVRSRSGLGACVNGFDEFGDACTDFTPITSSPAATAAAINYLYGTPGALPPIIGPTQATQINPMWLLGGVLVAVLLVAGGRR